MWLDSTKGLFVIKTQNQAVLNSVTKYLSHVLPLTKSSPDPRRRRRVQRTVRPNGLKKELAMVINETQRVNLNAAADALLSCAWALQEALKQ